MKSWSEHLPRAGRPRQARILRSLSCQDYAQEQTAQALEDSYRRGRIDGEKTLSELLLQQRQQLQDLQHGILASLDQALPQLIQTAEDRLIQLALQAAEKYICASPPNPEELSSLLRQALAQVKDARQISIEIHPEDLALLEHFDPKLSHGSPGQTIQWTPSPSITRGGCVVHTNFGLLDARSETRLQSLRKEFSA